MTIAPIDGASVFICGKISQAAKKSGTCSANPASTVVGNTSSHNPSADRRVQSVTTPPNIKPNNRATLIPIKPFVANTTANSAGSDCHSRSASGTNAQNPPSGGNASNDNPPVSTHRPVTGRRAHNPPIWVRFWVMLFRTILPVAITSSAMLRTKTNSIINAVCDAPEPIAINTSPRYALVR